MPSHEILLEKDGISQNLKTWSNQLEIPYTTILTRHARYKEGRLLIEDVLAPNSEQKRAERLKRQQLADAQRELSEPHPLTVRLEQELALRNPRARLSSLLTLRQTKESLYAVRLKPTSPSNKQTYLEVADDVQDSLNKLTAWLNRDKADDFIEPDMSPQYPLQLNN